MEPHLRKNEPGVTNGFQVVDLQAAGADPLDWFGTAQHWKHTDLPRMNYEDSRFSYDHQTQRFWRISARNASGADIGGLKIMSRAWGPPLFGTVSRNGSIGRYNETNLSPEDSLLNHWWFRSDVFVSNANWTRQKAVLLSPSLDTLCHRPHGSTQSCVSEEDLNGDIVVYAVMKKYHLVTTEELPVQNGFTNVELDISPHNLISFNPNILARYMPAYSTVMQNPNMLSRKIYTPPYRAEHDL